MSTASRAQKNDEHTCSSPASANIAVGAAHQEKAATRRSIAHDLTESRRMAPARRR